MSELIRSIFAFGVVISCVYLCQNSQWMELVFLSMHNYLRSCLLLDDAIWQRRSLGDKKMVQTVVEGAEVQAPFHSTDRYSEVHSMTGDGYLESKLTITNLQRTDVAEYSCMYNGSSVGAFKLDVIGKLSVYGTVGIAW